MRVGTALMVLCVCGCALPAPEIPSSIATYSRGTFSPVSELEVWVQADVAAWVCCKGGELSICISPDHVRRTEFLCIVLHERHHLAWMGKEYPDLCHGLPDGYRAYWSELHPGLMREQECAAAEVEAACYWSLGMTNRWQHIVQWSKRVYGCGGLGDGK